MDVTWPLMQIHARRAHTTLFCGFHLTLHTGRSFSTSYCHQFVVNQSVGNLFRGYHWCLGGSDLFECVEQKCFELVCLWAVDSTTEPHIAIEQILIQPHIQLTSPSSPCPKRIFQCLHHLVASVNKVVGVPVQISSIWHDKGLIFLRSNTPLLMLFLCHSIVDVCQQVDKHLLTLWLFGKPCQAECPNQADCTVWIFQAVKGYRTGKKMKRR